MLYNTFTRDDFSMAIRQVRRLLGNGCRNVKRWRNANVVRRWVSAVLLDAESRFHRIQGYREIPLLIKALGKAIDTQEAVAWSRSTVTRPQREFPRQPGQALKKCKGNGFTSCLNSVSNEAVLLIKKLLCQLGIVCCYSVNA